MPPEDSDAYIRMSAKEMIYRLDQKIDRIDEKVDGLVVAHAALPAVFVSQKQIEDNRREALNAKRWAVSAFLSVVALVLTQIPL